MEDNMDNRDIEKKLQGAFSKAVPDVLDSVLQRCSEQGGSVIKMTENKRKKRRQALRLKRKQKTHWRQP